MEPKNKNIISAETHRRTIEVIPELSVNNTTFYKDINFLEIEIYKDDNNCSWITNEDVERLFLLREHIKETGQRNGFEVKKVGDLTVKQTAEITSAESKDLTTNEAEDIYLDHEDIYVEPSEPTSNFDLNEIIREGAKLKARELAMPDLVKRAIADQMTEEDLPEDLQEKVRLAREAANPKLTPTEIANSLLANYRKNLAG